MERQSNPSPRNPVRTGGEEVLGFQKQKHVALISENLKPKT